MLILRLHDQKLDLILEALNRNSESLGRLERDVSEMKADFALLKNRILDAQATTLGLLHQLDDAVSIADRTDPN